MESTVEDQEKVNLNTVLQAFFKRSRKLREADDQILIDVGEEQIIQANMSHLSSIFMFLNSLIDRSQSYILQSSKVNVSQQEGMADGIYYSIEMKSSEEINDYVPVSYDSSLFKGADQ